MILEHVELKNYRCFESLAVPLDPHLNVFVGSNGSGKTTILQAIANCLAPIVSRLPLEKKERVPAPAISDIRLLGEDRSAPFVQLSARSAGLGAGLISWDRTKLRDGSPTTKAQAPQGSPGLRALHTALDQIIDAHNAAVPYEVPVFAFYGTNRAVDVPHYRLRSSPAPKTFRRFAGLEGALAAKADFRRAVGWFDQYEQRDLREQRDARATQWRQELQAVRDAITQMIPGVTNPRIDSQTGRFAVDSRDPSGTTVKLYLDQLSDGYQVMLGVVMDFALRMAITNPPGNTNDNVLARPATLIIDEVDLHLHPSWQQRVIPDLRRTFPNTQLILSTHSPQVLSTVDVSAIRVIRFFDGAPQISKPQYQTKGVESAEILAAIMGVDPVPKVPEAQWLSVYRAIIEDGQEESQPATALRQRLLAHFGQDHPLILDCDRLIRFNAFKRRRAAGGAENAQA